MQTASQIIEYFELQPVDCACVDSHVKESSFSSNELVSVSYLFKLLVRRGLSMPNSCERKVEVTIKKYGCRFFRSVCLHFSGAVSTGGRNNDPFAMRFYCPEYSLSGTTHLPIWSRGNDMLPWTSSLLARAIQSMFTCDSHITDYGLSAGQPESDLSSSDS